MFLTMLQPIAQQVRPQNAQQVLDQMAQAMGQANAFKVRTVQVIGTIRHSQWARPGRMEAYYKSPNKMYLRSVLQWLDNRWLEMQQGYDGTVGWKKDPVMGLRVLQGAELAQMRWSAEIGASNDVRKALRNPKLAGRQKVGDREAFVITAQTTAGTPISVYIDTQRYLLLRMDMELATPMGRRNVTMVYEDYQYVDGIMYPFTTRQFTEQGETVLKTERVQHNVPISDAIFRMPQS